MSLIPPDIAANCCGPAIAIVGALAGAAWGFRREKREQPHTRPPYGFLPPRGEPREARRAREVLKMPAEKPKAFRRSVKNGDSVDPRLN